jgi:hypothetical protein
MDSDDRDSGKRKRDAERGDYGLGANPPGASVHMNDLPKRVNDYYSADAYRKSLSQARENLEFEPDGTVLHIKPLRYTLGLGVPGVLLLTASMLLHVLLKAYGNPFIGASGQDYAGLVRLLAMLTGGIMLIIAWPVKKPLDWTPEKQRELERERQRFHDKKFGGGGGQG